MSSANLEPLEPPEPPSSTGAVKAVPKVSETVTTLRYGAFRLAQAANYINLLARMVFSIQIGLNDKKLIRAHQRLLVTFGAYQVMSIVHKESELVCDGARAVARIPRSFDPGRVNPTQLARLLSGTNGDLLAAISRMQRIVEAGQIYRLWEVEKVHETRQSIVATQLLDDFMRRL